ncbi:hypothetical protein ACFLST_01655, partial [Chloroflexota bacterium]
MMRRFAKLRKDEAGYALLWVLLLLMVSSLILIPMMLIMNTGLVSSHVHDGITERFYAADVGIEDGSYKILHSDPCVPIEGGDPCEYFLRDEEDQPVEINGCTVLIEVSWEEEETYRIRATSTDSDSGITTTIESYVSRLDLTLMFGAAITSLHDANLQPNNWVDGDVVCGEQLTGCGLDCIAPGNEVFEYADIDYWPTAEDLYQVFWWDVYDLGS